MVNEQLLFGVLVNENEHYPTVGWNDFATPQSWRPSCSCGWEGLVIYRESDFHNFPKTLEEFVEINGLESILDKNAIFGSEDHSLIQILHHLDYSPENDGVYSEANFDHISQELKNLKLEIKDEEDAEEEIFDLLENLSIAAQEFTEYKKREHIWLNIQKPLKRHNAELLEVSLKEYLLKSWEKSHYSSEEQKHDS